MTNRRLFHRTAQLLSLLACTAALAACNKDDADEPGDDDERGQDSAAAGAGPEMPSGCKFDPSYKPEIDPANFVDDQGNPFAIDNPLYPLTPGTVFSYVEGEDSITIEVTEQRKEILGVSCVVVRDTHRDASGGLVEDTFDWFAQDADGNVWYFGEDTKEYENGEVSSTEGSWEAGVSGAQPGINMLAAPEVGDVYRQEYYACEAEDMATVIDVDVDVSVPFGDFSGCLETYDYSAFNLAADELKFYCPGVGFVMATTLSDASQEALKTLTPAVE